MEEKEIVARLSSPLYDAKGWLKLIGIAAIISGVFLIFSIIGILFCWLPIWMGVLLMGVASNIEKARQTGDSASMMESMNKLKTYFIISGVIYLITILGFVISLVITGGAILTGLGSMNF